MISLKIVKRIVIVVVGSTVLFFGRRIVGLARSGLHCDSTWTGDPRRGVHMGAALAAKSARPASKGERSAGFFRFCSAAHQEFSRVGVRMSALSSKRSNERTKT